MTSRKYDMCNSVVRLILSLNGQDRIQVEKLLFNHSFQLFLGEKNKEVKRLNGDIERLHCILKEQQDTMKKLKNKINELEKIIEEKDEEIENLKFELYDLQMNCSTYS